MCRDDAHGTLRCTGGHRPPADRHQARPVVLPQRRGGSDELRLKRLAQESVDRVAQRRIRSRLQQLRQPQLALAQHAFDELRELTRFVVDRAREAQESMGDR